MALTFVNREAESNEFDAAARPGGLLVVYGRRRVGKTRLLVEWLHRQSGWYSQAIEGPVSMQLHQIYRDLSLHIGTAIEPKSWSELLELLRLQKDRWVCCLDEFPYLVASDSSLPSLLQRWIDHDLPVGCTLILCGSSTHMMHSLFLNRTAPLYGRARKLLHVQPLSYAAFCSAFRLKPADMDSFLKFSLVGGIPKYWEFVEPRQSPVELAEALYFDYAPYLEQEPQRILRDEGISGLNAVAVLEAIGRGAERPSEIASRLGTAQTNLSRLFQQLIDASIVTRELPFGESLRSTKKTLYCIQDPTLRFWYRIRSPHQSLWRTYSTDKKLELLRTHAATVFEDFCRQRYPGAQRYWEGEVEIDIVVRDPDDTKALQIVEVKWRRLRPSERANLLRQLEDKWKRCRLSVRYARARFEVVDAGVLRLEKQV